MPSTAGPVFEVGAAFRLGDRLVEPRLNRLTRDGEAIQIEIKAMDVLLCLARRAGEVVTRQEIVDAVWATEFISDNTLTHAVAELRNALGDDARTPTFIETIHRRGYRLITAVEPAGPEEPTTGTVARFPVSKTLADGARNPYPGLAAFTESDAEFFFGREAEVAALWRKLTTRRLLAVIGPSGVGKSSLLRAGLIPAAPNGWGIRICQPGEAPFSALARALAPDFSDDPGALAALFELATNDTGFAVISRWRRRHDQALLVVDQLEELFTQSPPEVQARFAEVLGRLARETDTHVLLAMRDDFLYRCHDHGALGPVFADLTPIAQPSPDALARALALPARRCGYEFDNDGLVDEMVREVAEERAALPLLAFTAARLWEERDRENRLLTLESYQRIGGIHGALAGHAEATVASIGAGRLPVVREIFRNLVTAEGTRATREVDDLLSVFEGERVKKLESEKVRRSALPSVAGKTLGVRRLPSHSEQSERSLPHSSPARAAAAEVLRELIDARLLTSYEVATEDGGARRTVEIVHESLLAAWPRLVRWQAQDAEGALLRDQLRQAARTWHEHGRSDDLLWSGSAYREYAVWRDRYPGGLTELEEAFATAMTSLSTRRRRRRRIAAAAALALAVVVAAVFGTLWRRSAQETRRAEARKLIALGRVELDRNPSAALAFARASLEVAESAEARMLAVQTLWAGPPAFFVADAGHCVRSAFSPDDRRLACAGWYPEITVLSDDGGEPLRISGLPEKFVPRGVAFTPSGDRLLSWLDGDPSIRIFDPAGNELDTLPAEAADLLVLDEDTIATLGAFEPSATERAVRVWSLADHSSRLVARWLPPPGFQPSLPGVRPVAMDPQLRWLAHGDEVAVDLLALTGPDAGREVELGTHQGKVREVAFSPNGSRLVSADEGGGMQIWSVTSKEAPRSLNSSAPTYASSLSFGASGSKIGWSSTSGALVWSLGDPPDATPRLLRCPGALAFGAISFDREARWAAGGRDTFEMALWSLASPYPRVLRANTLVTDLAFTADSRFLASCGFAGAHFWPLSPEDGRQRAIDLGEEYYCQGIAADATSPSLLVATLGFGAFVVHPDGVAPRRLEGVPPRSLQPAALDTRAGLAAVADGWAPEPGALHVVELGSGATRSFPLRDPASRRDSYDGGLTSLGFAADGSVMSGGSGGVSRWDLGTGEPTRICDEDVPWGEVALSRSGLTMIALCDKTGPMDPVLVVDVLTEAKRRVTNYGTDVTAVAIDSTGERIATGDRNGVVRVGWATGEEPHLLIGHHELVKRLAFSPDGKWLASVSGSEIFLWPMPDLSKRPLHTLPHDELLAKLKTLTNLRAVRDPDSDTGWKIEIGPFPGWAVVPEWQP